MTRHCRVLIHRWTGLVMAGFLTVVGLTGSIRPDAGVLRRGHPRTASAAHAHGAIWRQYGNGLASGAAHGPRVRNALSDFRLCAGTRHRHAVGHRHHHLDQRTAGAAASLYRDRSRTQRDRLIRGIEPTAFRLAGFPGTRFDFRISASPTAPSVWHAAGRQVRCAASVPPFSPDKIARNARTR